MISLLSALRILIVAIGLAQFAAVAAGVPTGHAGTPRPVEAQWDAAGDTARVAILTAPPVVLTAAKPDLARPGAAILPVPLLAAPVSDELSAYRTTTPQAGNPGRVNDRPPARGPPLT